MQIVATLASYCYTWLMNKFVLDLNGLKFISSNPEIMGGMPVIKGTRIPISRILFLLKDGYTIDSILDDFPYVGKTRMEGAVGELISRLSA